MPSPIRTRPARTTLRGARSFRIATFVLAAVVALAALSARPVGAANLFPPGLSWRTLTSDHFYIHFPREMEPLAREVAELAEAVHARQSERLDWTPHARTHVVLVDNDDRANGFATPLPFNWMVLFVTQPDGDTGLMLNDRDWLRTLLVHEYTHILHLDRAEGFPLALRQVFGRAVWLAPFLFPNPFNPGWMIEGLATLEETEGTAGGRGRGALFQGILRAQAAEGELLPAAKAHHLIHRWPGGTVPYLYGVGYLDYLERTYGQGTVARLVAEYSDNPFPYLVAFNFDLVVPPGLKGSWNGWQRELEQEAANRVAAVQKRGMAAPERLTESGFQTGGPRVSPDGAWLAWSENTAYDHGRILLRRLDQDGAEPRELAWRNGGRDLAWSQDGRTLYFTQPEHVGSFRVFNDLYAVSVPRGKVRRLTHGARVREVDVGPDGRVVAVQNHPSGPATTALVLLEGKDLHPTYLLPPARNTVFSHPRFSPDGRTVAVTVTDPDGSRTLALVDVATGAARPVTDGRDMVGHAAWSPEGRDLVFTSDRTGTFNLFAYDTATERLRQATDAVGGAFTPEVTPDGRTLLFSGLNGGGLDLYRLPFDPEAWPPAPAAPPPAIAPELPRPSVALDPPRRYNALRHAYPRFWVPVIYSEGSQDLHQTYVGIATAGSDPLLRHQYLVQAVVAPDEALTEYSLYYAYDRLWPTLSLQVQRDFFEYLYSPANDLRGAKYEQDVSVDVSFPLIRFNHTAKLVIGYKLEKVGVISGNCVSVGTCGAPPSVALPDHRFVRAGLRYGSTHKYGLGISPTDGRRLGVFTEHARPEWGSTVSGESGTVDWAEFHSLSRRQVLAARLTGAGATGDLRLTAGGVPDAVEDPFDRDLSLRGYPERVLAGDRFLRGTLSYRFPLALPEWGWGSLPLFLEKLHGNLFVEGGRMHEFSGGWREAAAAGLEVGFDWAVGYFIPITLRVGVASGAGRLGETQAYVRLEGVVF